MTNTELSKSYWRYYLMLEKRLLEMADIVEIHSKNFKSFSNGFAMLLQSIGAELDNFFKLYCGYNLSDRMSISDYANTILNQEPTIVRQEVKVLNTDISIVPFENWNISKPAQSLVWWEAFDNIKHNRVGNIEEANMENTLKALSGLYLLEMKAYKKYAALDTSGCPKEPDLPPEQSRLFAIDNWNSRYVPLGSGFAVIDG